MSKIILKPKITPLKLFDFSYIPLYLQYIEQTRECLHYIVSY